MPHGRPKRAVTPPLYDAAFPHRTALREALWVNPPEDMDKGFPFVW